ncbi:MAG: metal ABC transporter substrate-binding protein [archaeon]|nr:metal ABC transporter substrate-binding protein [archaeon]
MVRLLGDLAKEIGGDRIEVTSIVPGGICPAHYDIKPSDVAAVSKANLLFRHGFEPWFDDLLEASGSKEVKVVKIPLSWGEPSLAIEMIKLINETLCEIDPHNAAYFKEREDNQYKSINETAQRLKEEAKQLNVSDVKVICMKWQEVFVKWLGFDIVATYGPPESLSLDDVNKLIKTGREENVTLVIDNLQSGTDFGKELASELGATQVILTNFPGAIPGTETYTKMIEYNARQIFDAI